MIFNMRKLTDFTKDHAALFYTEFAVYFET